MKKRKIVDVGDIIGVLFDKNMVAAGIVLHVSTYFRNCIMIGFYNQLFTSLEDIDIQKLGGEFIDVPNYTHVYPIREGRWHKVGHSPELLAAARIPELRVSYDIFYKDEFIRRVEFADFKKYPDAGPAGYLYVENQLRKYFAKT